MKIREMVAILGADVLCGAEKLDEEVFTAFGSDMMSDVLACADEQTVLLSGLLNPQVIRTAEMLDMECIVFVRGKQPSEEMIALAKEKGITLLATKLTMFLSCGMLYANGLQGGARS